MFFEVWFIARSGKMSLEGKIKRNLSNILSECMDKHPILKFEINKSNVDMLVKVKDKKELAAVAKRIKTVSSKEINSHLAARAKDFWAKGYAYKELSRESVLTVAKRIRNQEEKN